MDMPHTNIIIEILNKERAGRLCDEPALISLTVSSCIAKMMMISLLI
jgi:hypothetical protein